MSVEDRQIITEIKKGKIDRYYYVVKKYTSRIYNYVYKIIFDKEDIDDIVQEVFLSFYKAIDRFDENKKIYPYLFQITKNQLKMYFRTKKRHLPLNDKFVAEEKPMSDFAFFESILAYLPADHKKVIELFIDGFSYNEIAGEVKKPLNTIKTIIRRSRLKFAHLKKQYEKT